MITVESIKSDLSREWEKFETLMVSSLHSECGFLESINGHLLGHSGKKLRPLLALASAGAAGEVNDAAVTCAAVSELMHTATLLHDDVVDESDLRRGAPTVRSLFSPGASVLMGDYWLAKSVRLLVKLGDSRIMGMFSRTIEDLASGELLQMEKASSLDTTFDDYLEIIRCKTASLFVSAVSSAAVASGAPEEYVSALGEYALNLGLLFQMRDDILDYDISSRIGKDSDCDISERKITLPLFCVFDAVPGSRERVTALMEKVDVMASDPEKNRPVVDEVKRMVRESGGLSAAVKVLAKYADKAVEATGILPESRCRDFLAGVARTLAAG